MDLNVTSATGVSRTTSLPAPRAGSTAEAADRQAVSGTGQSSETASGIAVVATPKPLRFPWLSRLSEQLGAAAKQKPAFASAQVLGDHVDRSA